MPYKTLFEYKYVLTGYAKDMFHQYSAKVCLKQLLKQASKGASTRASFIVSFHQITMSSSSHYLAKVFNFFDHILEIFVVQNLEKSVIFNYFYYTAFILLAFHSTFTSEDIWKLM
ncbi:unnamed protein product [Acanthoscelides obtectus]|uniref:Uncharacterized protein n=1 Tax=Acanthoscelides obtectus TaxID=200917 RepID=A0A9P0K0B5_ACAOB|nr:unnamed protein product [Acanthoscelides obtectus]CAK1647183.1 hypothetical protein AOBTE_LOCUS15096 [Acanthoscelides obtectus]